MATTTVKATSNAGSITNFASGSFTGDGNATFISLGFNPRYFKLFNETDVVTWEKTEGTTAADAWKKASVATTPAATQETLDTGGHVTFDTTNRGVTLDTTAAPNAKVCSWVAWG